MAQSPITLHKLLHMDIPNYLLKILRSFLKDRKFVVKIGTDVSSTKTISTGVPQGAVLSPSLYNLYCSDIPTDDNSTIAQFADDTSILSQNHSLETAINNLQQSLNNCINWFQN